MHLQIFVIVIQSHFKTNFEINIQIDNNIINTHILHINHAIIAVILLLLIPNYSNQTLLYI